MIRGDFVLRVVFPDTVAAADIEDILAELLVTLEARDEIDHVGTVEWVVEDDES